MKPTQAWRVGVGLPVRRPPGPVPASPQSSSLAHLSLLRGEALGAGSLVWPQGMSRVGGDSLVSGGDRRRCGTGNPSPRIKNKERREKTRAFQYESPSTKS